MSDSDNQNDEVKGSEYLASPKKFHLEMPLYLNFDLSDSLVANQVYKNLNHSGTIDAYCILCEKDSVFDATDYFYDNTTIPSWVNRNNGLTTIEYTCSRDQTHRYHTYYFKLGSYFVKAGQVPSVADFQIPQSKQYRNVLGNDLYKEFTKGIGLAANGVGIGSFVYLRRIFENLIDEAYQLALGDVDFNDEQYKKERMDGKILLLKNHLPEFLVENRSLYSILSTGVHNLNEQECLEYFDAVKIGIEQILDEKIELQAKKQKAEEAKASIQGLHQKISGNSALETPSTESQ